MVCVLSESSCKNLMTLFHQSINPSSANPTKWSNTLKQFVCNLPTNCLSAFDHFVKLALKELRLDYSAKLASFKFQILHLIWARSSVRVCGLKNQAINQLMLQNFPIWFRIFRGCGFLHTLPAKFSKRNRNLLWETLSSNKSKER